MILSHYSADPLPASLSPVPSDPAYAALVGPYKPRGFWVSVDGEQDWVEWCVSEYFRLEHLAVRSVITLQPDANILILPTTADLTAFTNEYVVPDDQASSRWGRTSQIDWQRVYQKYQGLIIAPYCWALRLDLSWYYGWDCASGCIWDVRAIASIEQDMDWKGPQPRNDDEETAEVLAAAYPPRVELDLS